ncbi:hypothetical protein A3A66_04420 [Microgenomates group bacterium RIFCSPLOWO2_01_FULL_46_13]|nr:MAG: hypothetical protein A2783_04365 [Microgenomates group bacterium RIFCSPHIGHO2_01_FULL_45_11]OGV94215.1 MAG: hypothetical protein A3A66_04420 [Microgenomates group bacterium RIFCSPLOWO2_01_FULL_46_13]
MRVELSRLQSERLALAPLRLPLGLGIGIFLFLVISLGKWLIAQAQLGDVLSAADSAQVILSLIPSQPTVGPLEEFSIDVVAHPNGQQVAAAQVQLTFDETLFEVTSPTPFTLGDYHTLILPNCSGGLTPPCPATSSATLNSSFIVVGVNCTDEAGCQLPPTDRPFRLARLHLRAKEAGVGRASFSLETLIASDSATQVAAVGAETDVLAGISGTAVSLPPCALNFDLTADGRVDVVDVMLVASAWNQAPGTNGYDGQFDLDADNDIDVVDIQNIANGWGGTCP